jgi:hypothetical protein
MYRLKFAFLAIFILYSCPFAAMGEDISSTQLINQAKAYDTQEVTYSGEVIGDILNAGDHVWLNVSDGSNALGIWAVSELASDVEIAGRYSQHGDDIRITGIFNRACPEHGGDMDIHAESITLLNRGYPIIHEVQRWKLWLAAGLTIGAAVCLANLLVRVFRKSYLQNKPR